MNKGMSVSIAGLLLGLAALPAAAIVWDGKFDPSEGYTNVFNITYTLTCYDAKGCETEQDPGVIVPQGYTQLIPGGILALGSIGNKQYVFYSHPKGFKDNSYTDGLTDTASTVGWGTANDAHKQGEYAGSEHFGFELDYNGAAAGGGFLIRVEYDHTDTTPPSKVSVGTAQTKFPSYEMEGPGTAYTDAIQSKSTLMYNAAANPGDNFSKDKAATGLGANSPITVAPDGVNCLDEYDSSDACYKILANEPGNPDPDIDWVFEAGVELQFMGGCTETDSGAAAAQAVDGEPTDYNGDITPCASNANPFFVGADGTTALNFATLTETDVLNYFGLVATHASPSKSFFRNPEDRIPDDDDTVPVPAPVALLGLGLVLMQLARRRRAA